MSETNPLVSDRTVEFLLYEVLEADRLCELPYFADHARETFDLCLGATRRLARQQLYPAYKPMDEEPPRYVDGHIVAHPVMQRLYPQIAELGIIPATRPYAVGGQQLPYCVAALASSYLMAGNVAAQGYAMLTSGAARLIEAFGSEELKAQYMVPMYEGRWTGTMALTEPQAGSSLADVECKAVPTEHGHYRIEGTKVFISGGDQDFTENIVHLTLARIEGAPPGVKGLSLFAIPKRRFEHGELVDNDAHAAGTFHKLGWRGLPSIALNFGEGGACHGFLVGEANRGLAHMFQMMNEARLNIGIHGTATASVAYLDSLAYALERPQGRARGAAPDSPQVPIVQHDDVRRMLLRQKAIVEGALALVTATARFQDLAEHGRDEHARRHGQTMLDLLTPMAKTFPAEKGFEANTLAVQIHGGYGYTSEFPAEAWLRDQKLNSIHEGTTGIQSLDLLGRKVGRGGEATMQAFASELQQTLLRAEGAGVQPGWCQALRDAHDSLTDVTLTLLQQGQRGHVEPMLRHSVDYMDLFSTVVVAWQWLSMAAAAKQGLAKGSAASAGFYEGKLCAAQYWIRTELARVPVLAELCKSGEDSYARMQSDWF